ncbi:hypothetical protein [Polyangium mundeleinium]|uniref:Secreted protein n=1 Tax=Polyangium mundeleinium TaxID=2995306 RepID=A0ABT5EKY7_9BACT|nr:hypothetical protein [Polyangium mundeleinium]MDC0742456.1 hypothetical protein [Polyangium mundeleinium]
MLLFAMRVRSSWPRLASLLPSCFALASIACGSDLFHATDWATLCDTKPTAKGCAGQGGGGAGGMGGAGGAGVAESCIPCANLASARVAKPDDVPVCPSSVDVHALLDQCRCDAMSVCYPSCSLTPACGSTAVDVEACDACVETSCGPYVLSCLAQTAP